MNEEEMVVMHLDADPRDDNRVLVTVGRGGREDQILNLHIAVVSQEGLRTGLEVPLDMIARLRKADEFQTHYNRALNFIAVRPRSESEVRVRLRQKGVPSDDIDPVIMRLQRAGYLDDAEFARMWVRDRTRVNPRGPRLIKQELYKKGVSRVLIDEVMAEYEDTLAQASESLVPQSLYAQPIESDDLEEDSAEPEEPQVEQALDIARRKMNTYGKLDDATFRRRMSAFLLRRGYGYDVVAKVMRRLRSDADDEVMEL